VVECKDVIMDLFQGILNVALSSDAVDAPEAVVTQKTGCCRICFYIVVVKGGVSC
jgi:hypothetical protein